MSLISIDAIFKLNDPNVMRVKFYRDPQGLTKFRIRFNKIIQEIASITVKTRFELSLSPNYKRNSGYCVYEGVLTYTSDPKEGFKITLNKSEFKSLDDKQILKTLVVKEQYWNKWFTVNTIDIKKSYKISFTFKAE